MAVEARHLNLFPSHLLSNSRLIVSSVNHSGCREMLNSTGNSANPYSSSNQIPTVGGGGGVVAGVEVSQDTHHLLPFNNTHQHQMMSAQSQMQVKSSQAMNGVCNLPQVSGLKDDSGLTSNNIVLPPSRKRSRDSSGDINNLKGRCGVVPSMTFLGEDLSLQMLQHQLDIDRMISLHMEKVRMEMENRRRKQSRRIIEAIEEAVAKRLRDKEDQMEKIGKLNWALEERVKSLYVENQIWRDLAQTNEATANALRSNLEQVLNAQTNNNNDDAVPTRLAGDDEDDDDDVRGRGLNLATAEDAESCCGSSGPDGGVGVETSRWRMVGLEGKMGNVEDINSIMNSRRMCNRCGGAESSVLLLPCRHLCLCTGCGPYVDICPICNSDKTASVHVNLS